MKRFFVLLSAVALFGLTACTMQEQLGPKEEGVKNDVKSAFSFNVATKANTKATAEDVQANGNFRGMTGMNLFVTTGNPATVDFMPGYQYPLGSLATAALAEKSSKVYYLSLPVGVDNMVFYGRANRNESAQVPDPTPERYGLIKYNVGPNKQSTNFQSVPILADASKFTDVSVKLEKIMNTVFDPSIWPDPESPNTGINDRALIEIFKRVTQIRQGEFRDGSGAAILRIIQEVKKIVDLQIEEAGIPGLLDPTNTVTDPTWDISNVTAAIEIRLAIGQAVLEPDDEGQYPGLTDPITTLGSPELDGFPGNLGLPAGSAQLTYANNKFAYAEQPDAFGGAASLVSSVTKFTYPVELTYYVNSPVRVTSQAVKEEDFPVTVPTWSAANWGAKWPESGINGVIAPETQGVALQNNIQYGMALLKTTVKYGAEVLEDNTHNMAIVLEPTANVPNQKITVDDKSFTLKGILVGGQPGQVDWQWVGTGQFNNVVYDHNFAAEAATIPTPQGKEAYTMVFDNLQAGETADQADVFVALELVNNAKDAQGNPMDFYGRDNLIPAGGTFYLVGKLDFANADKDITYPENTDGNGLRFPPFDGVKNKKVVRVFMQDYVTSANFTINSLKNAYVTVPDLRNLEMTFGLSVDLEWTAGMSFDVALD